MRFWLVCSMLGLFGLSTAQATDGGSSTEDAGLVEFFQSYLDRSFRDEPLSATRLGDHRFDDRLDDLSAEARAGYLERDRRALAELPMRVDRTKLSRDARIDFDIFRHHLVRSI